MMAGKKANTAAADGSEVAPTHYQVQALPAVGFHRAGRYWPASPVLVPAEELNEEQLIALMTEPALLVLPVVQAETGSAQ
jgi:hypothetical protein